MRQAMRKAAWLAALAVAALTGPTGAQGVYRCGNTYSHQPCVGGSEIQVQDARTAGQAHQTSEAAKRDAHSAAVMEKDRLKLEGKATSAIIPLIAAPPPLPAASSPAPGARAKKPQYFTAKAPRKPPVPKKKKPKPEEA